MKRQAPSNEIATIEWQRVSALAWKILAGISLVLALTAEYPLRPWQFQFVAGLGLSYLAFELLARFTTFSYSATPVIIYLLISPIFLGNQPEKPWMSIGLIIFAAMIYFARIPNFYVAFSVVLTLCIFQSLIATKNYRSISDNADIALLGSYFSFIWVFVIGISSILIFRNYQRTSDNIQTRVDEEFQNSIEKLTSLKLVNIKDSRNLKLHGTILNTLLHMRNMLKLGENIDSLWFQLKSEVEALRRDFTEKKVSPLSRKVEDLVFGRTLNRVQVQFSRFESYLASPEDTELIIEILREYLLNTEKHTFATEMEISSNLTNNNLTIVITDNAPQKFSHLERRDLISNTKNSRSLQKLLQSRGARIDLSTVKRGRERRAVIIIPDLNLELELRDSISKARTFGLNDFSLNFVRASSIAAILALPGYFALGINWSTLLLLALAVVNTFLAVRWPLQKFWLLPLAIFSALIIPSMSTKVETCTQIESLPWMFNVILTAGFLTAITVKHRVLKWIPISVLAAQSFIYPFTYPENCQNIFIGSLPGIPLIIALALSLLGVRKREIAFDEGESLEIARMKKLSNQTDLVREKAFQELIDRTSIVIEKLSNEQGPEKAKVIESLTLMIQEIQTFLVCAEHFESEFIRGLFNLYKEDSENGVPGRISILGQGFERLDNQIDSIKVLDLMRRIKSGKPINVTLVNASRLELHISAEKSPAWEREADELGISIHFDENG